MGKVSIEHKHERLNQLIYENWEIYRRGEIYRNVFKKFNRDKKALGRSCGTDFNHPEYKDLICKFQGKYHIPPINPKLNFVDVGNVYKEFIKKGYEEPFPLEVLFFKGRLNVPIWVHTTLKSKIFIPKPLIHSSSYYLAHLDAILGNRDVRIKGSKSSCNLKPFIESPEIYSNGISLNLNLNATAKIIKNAVKNILIKQGAREHDIRGRDFKKFLIKMNIFDFKEKHTNISFKKLAYRVAEPIRRFYPNTPKSIPEITKFLSDGYNDACRLINPGKKKIHRSKKKDFSLVGYKDYKLIYGISDYRKLELSGSRGKPKLITKRIGDIIFEEEEKIHEQINLHDEREARKMAPIKILTTEEYLKKLISS